MTYFHNWLALALMGISLGGAHAEPAPERAALNAIRITEYLHSTLASQVTRAIANIESGQYKRLAPEQPVWIVEILGGTIVYYQGEPTFKNKPAAQLIDDDGQRFGERALTYGKASKSGWIGVSLGGKRYQAYCKAQYPFVTCSLAL